VPRRSLRPSHRRTDEYQLVRDALSGILVPASRIVRSDVEGLRGLEIGDQFAFDRRARVSPSYEDLRGITPAVQKYDPLPVSGGEGGFPYEEEEWLPTDLDDLLLWVDQDGLRAVGDGVAISSWDDQSDEDEDLDQATAGFRPTVEQVGTDATLDPIWEAQFDGDDDVLETAVFAAVTDPILIGVCWRSLTTSYSNLRLVSSDTVEVGIAVTDSAAQSFIHMRGGATGTSFTVSPRLGTELHYIVALNNGADSYLRLDGRLVASNLSGLLVATITQILVNPPEPCAHRALVVANTEPSDEEILLLESHLRYRARS
jgi:hypothetical protein